MAEDFKGQFQEFDPNEWFLMEGLDSGFPICMTLNIIKLCSVWFVYFEMVILK